MGVIIDTSGQIYAKLNAANASLATLLSDEVSLLTMGSAIAKEINSVQTTLCEVLAQIEAEITSEGAALASVETTLGVMAPQLAALYNLIVKAPVTIGVDIAGATTSKQPIPTPHGP